MIYKLVMQRWNGDELIEDVTILETNSIQTLYETAKACNNVCKLTGLAGYEFVGIVNLTDYDTADKIANEIVRRYSE